MQAKQRVWLPVAPEERLRWRAEEEGRECIEPGRRSLAVAAKWTLQAVCGRYPSGQGPSWSAAACLWLRSRLGAGSSWEGGEVGGVPQGNVQKFVRVGYSGQVRARERDFDLHCRDAHPHTLQFDVECCGTEAILTPSPVAECSRPRPFTGLLGPLELAMLACITTPADPPLLLPLSRLCPSSVPEPQLDSTMAGGHGRGRERGLRVLCMDGVRARGASTSWSTEPIATQTPHAATTSMPSQFPQSPAEIHVWSSTMIFSW